MTKHIKMTQTTLHDTPSPRNLVFEAKDFGKNLNWSLSTGLNACWMGGGFEEM